MKLKDIMEVESMIERVLDMAYNDVSDAITVLQMCNAADAHVVEGLDRLINAIFEISYIKELISIVWDAIDEHVESAEPDRWQKEEK